MQNSAQIAKAVVETRQHLVWLKAFGAGISATYPAGNMRDALTDAVALVVAEAEGQLAALEHAASATASHLSAPARAQ